MKEARREVISAEILGAIKDGELWKCTGLVVTQVNGEAKYGYTFNATNPFSKEKMEMEVKHNGAIIYEENGDEVNENVTDKHLLIDARAAHWLVINSALGISRARKKSDDSFGKSPTYPATTKSVMLRFVGYGADSHKRQVIGDIATTVKGTDSPQIFSFTAKDIWSTLKIECDGLTIYDKVDDESILNDEAYSDIIGITEELVPVLDTVTNNFLVRHLLTHI